MVLFGLSQYSAASISTFRMAMSGSSLPLGNQVVSDSCQCASIVPRSRTMRADNYALSEETKRLRDSEQARLTDYAYEEAKRLLHKHRSALDRVAQALLEKETLDRSELQQLLADVAAESRSSETIGMVRALPMRD